MSSERLARWTRVVAVGALLLGGGGCADVERGPAPPQPDAGPDVAPAEAGGGSEGGGAATFASIRPLLNDGCGRCHAPGKEAGDTKFLLTGDAMAEYTAVRALVDPSAPAQSRLLVKASGQGHQGGAIYKMGSAEYNSLLAWIQGGANP